MTLRPFGGFFVFLNLFIIYLLFIFGCVGSSFLGEGFFQLRQAGATLHRDARASHYCGLSLRSTGSRRAGSVVVAHGPSCSVTCGIFPDQGSNPCPLHWQADSQPLRHQGSPKSFVLMIANLIQFVATSNLLSRLAKHFSPSSIQDLVNTVVYLIES